MNEGTGKIDAVSLTQALVREGAMSGEEGGVASIVRDAMYALQYDEVTTDELGNVIGLFGPRNAPVKLLFDGHMDVVPAVGNWSRNPFSGDLLGDKIHGRGTTDMKGPLAAAICGVAEAAKNNALNARIAVSASVMEEVIEGAALAKILDIYQPESVVICEPSNLKLKTAQRGCVELLIHVSGKPAHAAFPDQGINALELAANAISSLSEMEMPIDPVLGKMVLVPTDIMSTPYPSISALPSKVTVRYDRRTGVGERADQIIAQMYDILKQIDPVAFEIVISESTYTTYTNKEIRMARDLPAWHIEETANLVKMAQSCLDDLGMPFETGCYDFCTNGSQSAGRCGIPTIGFGPGMEQDAHIIDETIAIDALLSAQAFYSLLVKQCINRI